MDVSKDLLKNSDAADLFILRWEIHYAFSYKF